ncbi:MAG: DNA repair protein RecO [Bacteroidales bacterium]
MIEKTPGIVLHQIKYGDTGLIVHLYTRRWGRLGILVQGARSRSGKRKPALFQPITLLELDIDHKSSRELQQVREVRNFRPFVHLMADPVKSSIALFLAEILYKVLREEESNPPLFDFIADHLQLLDLAEEGVANFHLYFLVQLTRYLGFYPGEASGEPSLWFNLESGTFQPDKPTAGLSFSPENGSLLQEFMQSPPARLAGIRLNRTQRNELLEALLNYYRFHLEGFGEVKSLPVLTALFS